jgi:hypothetical protein
MSSNNNSRFNHLFIYPPNISTHTYQHLFTPYQHINLERTQLFSYIWGFDVI